MVAALGVGSSRRNLKCVVGQLMSNFRHGYKRSKAAPEYGVWRAMRQRCNSPSSLSYKNYGAKGVTVCDAWMHSFEAFILDMGPRPTTDHSLERLDNFKGYEPGNCVWATATEQSSNRRNNIRVKIGSETVCLKEAAKRAGLNYHTVYARIKRHGWSVEDALEWTGVRY